MTAAEPSMPDRCRESAARAPVENCKPTREQLQSSQTQAAVFVAVDRGQHNQTQQTYRVDPARLHLSSAAIKMLYLYVDAQRSGCFKCSDLAVLRIILI